MLLNWNFVDLPAPVSRGGLTGPGVVSSGGTEQVLHGVCTNDSAGGGPSSCPCPWGAGLSAAQGTLWRKDTASVDVSMRRGQELVLRFIQNCPGGWSRRAPRYILARGGANTASETNFQKPASLNGSVEEQCFTYRCGATCPQAGLTQGAL